MNGHQRVAGNAIMQRDRALEQRDEAIRERDEALARISDAMFWLTVILATAGGEIRVTTKMLRTIRRDAVVERYEDVVTRETVWRVEA